MRLFSRCHSSGRCVFGSHCPLGVTQREDALLRARALLVAPGAAERRVEVAGLERVEQRLGLEQAAAALRADANGCVPSAIASSLVWTISRAPISAA
jgi:hypothetical protein